MRVLIVESSRPLGELWKGHLDRQGNEVLVARNEEMAINQLMVTEFNVIVLNLLISEGSAIAVADYASYRQPLAKVIFVTNTTFFSDGSIFQHIPNACAYIQSDTAPADIAAMVEHYATH